MKISRSITYKTLGLVASIITIYVFIEARFPEYSFHTILNIRKSQEEINRAKYEKTLKESGLEFYEDERILTAPDEVGPFGKLALGSMGKAFYFGELQTIDKKRTKYFDITFPSDISTSLIYGGIPVGKYVFSIDDEDLKRYYVEIMIMENYVTSIDLPSLDVYY